MIFNTSSSITSGSVTNISNGSLNTTGTVSLTSGSSISISGSSISISGSSISSIKTKYFILGEYFELDLYDNGYYLSIMISTLNVLGRPFYEDLKKQPVHLPNELTEAIEKRLTIIERDSKIDSILNKE